MAGWSIGSVRGAKSIAGGGRTSGWTMCGWLGLSVGLLVACAVEDDGGPAPVLDGGGRSGGRDGGGRGADAGIESPDGAADAGVAGDGGADSAPSADDALGAAAPSCTDGAQNGAETDIDCGGTCSPCPPPASCRDGIHNHDETALDCGGSCDGCGVGQLCLIPADCATGICVAGLCAASFEPCANGLHDGAETDLDCGGPECGPCRDGEACSGDGDCLASMCEEGVCRDESCRDGARNQGETDVDCGGPCQPCPTGSSCADESDCASRRCEAGLCTSCSDGLRTGTEGGVDCGGPCFYDCPGAPCTHDLDCNHRVCASLDDGTGVCSQPCEVDAECQHLGPGMACSTFCVQDNRGEPCSSGLQCSHGDCVDFEGGLCGDFCESAWECGPGEACALVEVLDDVFGYSFSCVPIGQPCDFDNDCMGGLCRNDRCTSDCTNNTSCPEGHACVSSRCQPL